MALLSEEGAPLASRRIENPNWPSNPNPNDWVDGLDSYTFDFGEVGNSVGFEPIDVGY